jgi:hypothetical protein
MAQQIAYNMQNNLPFALNASPNDAGASSIAESIMSQAQVLASTTQSAPTAASQVSASTTGSNPITQAAETALGYMSNPIQSSLNAGNAVAASPTVSGATGWLQSHIANYGLVVLGGLLVLGALLISQRDKIQTVVETAGKAAELAG